MKEGSCSEERLEQFTPDGVVNGSGQSEPSAKNPFIPSEGDSSKNYGTADFRSPFRQIHHTSNVCLLEDESEV